MLVVQVPPRQSCPQAPQLCGSAVVSVQGKPLSTPPSTGAPPPAAPPWPPVAFPAWPPAAASAWPPFPAAPSVVPPSGARSEAEPHPAIAAAATTRAARRQKLIESSIDELRPARQA